MPSRTKPLWILTMSLLVGAPVLNVVYWLEVLKSGVLPHDADTVAPLMFGGVVAAVLIAPFVLGVTWLSLRGYDPRTKLFAWRMDRPMRSLSASLVFGGTASLLAASLIGTLFGGYPWYEYILVALLPPGIFWLLAMRAAIIEQADSASRPESISTAL